MQTRLPSKATTSFRALFPARNWRGIIASAPTSRRTADPEIREELVHHKESDKTEDAKPSKEEGPFAPPYAAASPRLESTGVNNPLDPTMRQKRSVSTDAICAGVDGTPLPKYEDEDRRRREEEEDDKAYYRHHKASPLAEIEVVDTRKPITRATDGTYGDYEGSKEKEVMGWLPEQLDTAEEALQRAVRIWKESAMRGDPDSPQSRVLKALHGES